MFFNIFLIVVTVVICLVIIINEFYGKDSFSFDFLILFNMLIFILGFSIIVYNNHYSAKSIRLFGLELLILVICTNLYSSYLKGNKSIFIIIQYFTIISLIMIARISIAQGYRQMAMLIVSVLAFSIVVFLYDTFYKYRHSSLVLVVLFIGLLLATNTNKFGSKNWITIDGIITFQPSEFMKIIYCLFLASLFSLFKEYKNLKLIISGVVTAIICGILVLQNDYGTALIFYSLFIVMSYVITTNRYFFIVGFVLTLLGGGFVYKFERHIRMRVEAWLNPYKYPDTSGYQIIRGIEAFKRGGLLGKGLYGGSPRKIPVVVSDFILAGIGEELGIVVVSLIILMFLLLSLVIVSRSFKIKNNFDFFVINSILITIMFQSFIIVGGVTKLIPLTGVTLPFISYGGSSLLGSYIGFGIIAKITSKEKTKERKHKRNKPMRRVRMLFATVSVAMVVNLIYIVYFYH